MSKQFKIVVLANIVLSILFIVSNLIYSAFATGGHSAKWSPLWLTFHNDQAAATIGDLGAQVPNFSFYFFWAAVIINLYAAFKIQKSTQTKQQPLQHADAD